MTRLEFERRRKGLTQERLAKEILYSRYVISDLERKRPGRSDVCARLADALERYFGIPFEELIKTM